MDFSFMFVFLCARLVNYFCVTNGNDVIVADVNSIKDNTSSEPAYHVGDDSTEVKDTEKRQEKILDVDDITPVAANEIGETSKDVSDNDDHEESPDIVNLLPDLHDEIRLPQTLRPSFYQISIFPNFYGTDPASFWYECETMIRISCIESTNVVILHSVGNDIHTWTISDRPENADEGLLLYNHDYEMVEIYVGFMLTAGQEYMLTLKATSPLTTSLRGIYVSPYKTGNKTEYLVTTMMEPTDARRVFPCFDEPDFKAVFTFHIKRRADVTSVTNLPKRTTVGPDEDGYYTDIFDEPQNVPMSSYLVAFVVGDLAYLESSVNNITFRTISRKAAVNQTRYALDAGMKFMEFFEEYFQIPYSLPKEDMIAVPTMSFSGMEHWGLITYKETAMLYEEGVSSLDDKEWTTIIIAHEIAHQWFGNLVSPYWWDDLWLNEGFATYMMYLAVDRVMPEWNMMNKLVVDYRGVQNVMNTDDNIFSHPIYIESVQDPVEIMQIFDLISYAKGGSVIRMMNFFLGEETFRKGLTRFLKSYSYQTATHLDLWESLSQQAREDEHAYSDVKEVMNTWIVEKNYPIVMVTKKDNVTLELTQSAFLRDEDQRSKRSHVLWKIPFVYTTNLDENFEQTFEDIYWLNNRTLTVTDTRLPNVTWLIGNALQYGFYRVNYDVTLWEEILHQLNTDHTVIHPINRAQIINDAWNIARAGLLDIGIALKTFDYLDSETDFVPWKAAIREINTLKSSLQLTSVYGVFENFMRKKLEKAYLETTGASSHYERVQYTMIAKEACFYGLQTCVNDAMDKFNTWIEDSKISIDPDLKETIYCTGVRYGGREAWEMVLQRCKDSESPSEKRFLINALSCTDTPWILHKLIELVMETDTFYRQEEVVIIMNIMMSPVGRLLIWSILDKYWATIVRDYHEFVSLFTGIVQSMTMSITTNLELNMFKQFLLQNSPLGADSTVEINLRSPIGQHDEVIRKWLQTHYGGSSIN